MYRPCLALARKAVLGVHVTRCCSLPARVRLSFLSVGTCLTREDLQSRAHLTGQRSSCLDTRDISWPVHPPTSKKHSLRRRPPNKPNWRQRRTQKNGTLTLVPFSSRATSPSTVPRALVRLNLGRFQSRCFFTERKESNDGPVCVFTRGESRARSTPRICPGPMQALVFDVPDPPAFVDTSHTTPSRLPDDELTGCNALSIQLSS